MLHEQFEQQNVANSIENQRFEFKNAANTAETAASSSKMLQTASKMGRKTDPKNIKNGKTNNPKTILDPKKYCNPNIRVASRRVPPAPNESEIAPSSDQLAPTCTAQVGANWSS